MVEIKKALRLPRLKYYETHLSLLNCILPEKMTPTEIEVIAAFMSLDGELATYRFGPTAKKVIMAQMQLSPAGLSNHLMSLIKKGFLRREKDTLTMHPLLIPEPGQQGYLLKLINTQNGTSH